MPKRVLHYLEYLVVRFVFFLFGCLSIDGASNLGGWLGRKIGPCLKAHKVARANLEMAFAEKKADEIEKILDGMWDNLGRTFAEYPHLDHIRLYDNKGKASGRVEVVGTENIDLLKEDDKPGIFLSAHLANWEISGLSLAQRNLPFTLIYRAANNPFIDALIRRARRSITEDFAAKGSQGARSALGVLNKGGHLALLADQKMNDGIAVPFFGRDAMTAPAPAQLALKFDCPLVPARVTRLKGATFRVTLFEPMALPRSGERHKDVETLTRAISERIEEWVRETPEQWMWVHRRWPKA